MDLQNGDSLASGCLWKASGSSFAADQQPVVACLLVVGRNLIGSTNGHVCPFWLSLVGPRDKAGRTEIKPGNHGRQTCAILCALIPPTNRCVLLCKSYIARRLWLTCEKPARWTALGRQCRVRRACVCVAFGPGMSLAACLQERTERG